MRNQVSREELEGETKTSREEREKGREGRRGGVGKEEGGRAEGKWKGVKKGASPICH